MKRNNGGYTLVELLVIIAIMGVLTTMAAMSISVIFSTGARQGANETDALLTECKVNCMSRAGAEYVRFYMDANGDYHGAYRENGVDQKDTVLSSRKISVSYRTDEGADTVVLDETNSLYVAFDRATGGLRLFGGDADPTNSQPPNTAKCIITVTGGGKTYTVTVDALTGIHRLNG